MIDKVCIFFKTTWKAATKEDKIFCFSFLVGVLLAIVFNYVVPLPSGFPFFLSHLLHKITVIAGAFVISVFSKSLLSSFVYWFEGFYRKFNALYYGVEKTHKEKKDKQKDKMQQEINQLKKEIEELTK